MDCRAKISRKLVASYIRFMASFVAMLLVGCAVSTVLTLAAFPHDTSWKTLLAFPVAIFCLTWPIMTAIWLWQASWVGVCQGVVKQTVFLDGQIKLRLDDRRDWVPKRTDGRLLRIDHGTEIDVLQNVWGRQKVVWLDGQRKRQELVL